MARADTVIARLARTQHRAVANWQLEPLGVSRRALALRAADGRLRRIHRGVYVVGTASLTLKGAWIAAVLACGPEAVLSHRDGTAHWDLRPCNRSSVDVTVPVGGRRSRRGITVHEATLHPEDRATLDGIPVTSLARTLLDLAAVVDAKQVQRAYERAERLRLLDVRAINRLLERSNGHRGAGVLRRLLAYDPSAAADALSEPERDLVDIVRAAGLPTPKVNVLVEGFLVDAYWPEHGLVVEVQSYGFHSDRATFERDHMKLAHLKSTGLDVVAITDTQVKERPAAVSALIRRLLAERAAWARRHGLDG